MKKLIQQFFQPTFSRFNAVNPAMALDLATAVLMVEVSRADFSQDESERQSIRRLLLEHLSLCEEEIDILLEDADKEADRLVSLQHITRQMNEELDLVAKTRVIELMWMVAYADGEKHHYEEHLLRQVADLLYVPHADFIRARHKAEASA